jgi:hypothetical protein
MIKIKVKDLKNLYMRRYLTVKVLIFFIMLFYCGFSLFNYSSIEEDAFIVFKYAENLINGYGHVFNKGGERIEACSTLTWLYLLTLFRALGCSLPTTSKMLGIFFGCFSLFLIFKITRYFTPLERQPCHFWQNEKNNTLSHSLKNHPSFLTGFTDKIPWVIFPSLLTSISIPFLIWNQKGLETSLYTLVFLSLILICLDRTLFVYWPIISLVLVSTRPEGIFILLGLAPVFYFYRERRKEIIYSFIMFSILFLMMIAIRFFYFHDFMPSAFYIKVYPSKYILGFRYIHFFLRDYYLYYFFIPIVYLVCKRWNWQEKRSILFGFLIVYLICVVLVIEEGSKPFYRPLVPIVPVVYIYVITGIGQAFDKLEVKRKLLVWSYVFIFACATLFLSKNYLLYHYHIVNPISKNLMHFITTPRGYLKLCLQRIREPAKSGHLLVGEFIKRNYFKGTKLVYDQMGRVPYGAGRDYYFIDSWGLIDKAIGHYHFHERSKGSSFLKCYEKLSTNLIKTFFPDRKFLYTREDVLDHLFGRNPDVILIYQFILIAKDRFPYLLTRDSRFKENYNLKYFITGTLFFERKGLIKKPLNIPDGLSVVSAEEYYTLRKDRPLF